jgi:hypothetical protein
MISQKFTVQQNGLVKGGIVSYLLDPVSGSVQYKGSIVVGKWFVSKTYESSGTYHVDPKLLKASAVTPGTVVRVGALTIAVTSLVEGLATAALSLFGPTKLSGTAILITNDPSGVVQVGSVDSQVTAFGFNLTVNLRP